MKLGQCVIPIHQQTSSKRVDGFGSGVLIRIDGAPFLFSARHVLMADNLRIPGTPFLHLDAVSRIFCSANTVDHAEPADVGFAHLAGFAADILVQAGYCFLDPRTQTVVAFDLPPATDLIFSGYPISKTETRVSLQQITSTRTDINEDAIADHAAHGCDPKLHLLMRYDRENVQHQGNRVIGPDPEGMSGGAIWYMTEEGIPLLAGIATHHDPQKKFLRGTKIQAPLAQAVRYLLANIPKEA